MNTDDEKCCCASINMIDRFFENYKYKISSPLAIILSVAGAVSGLLVSKFIVIGGVAIAITNCSVFFSSILLDRYAKANKNLQNDNISLQNENRRLTTFCKSLTNTPTNIQNANNAPNIQHDGDTDRAESIGSVEPVNFDSIHKINKLTSFAFPTE